MASLSLSLLGPFQARLDDRPMPRLPTVRAQALLVFLAVETALGAAAQRREALVELLWPGMPAGSARKNLRTTLYYLRRDIGGGDPALLLTNRQTVQINPEYPLELDVADFLDLLDGRQQDWPGAVVLYRGDFLADFTVPEAIPFEEWVMARRTAFRRQFLGALNSLASQAIATGRFAEAEEMARHQLELDNLRESAWRQLMETLAQDGRRSEALAAHEAAVELLWKELGVDPQPETTALFEAIRSGTLAKVDAGTEERQGIAGQSGQAAQPPSHNLPAQLAVCIGREVELGQLADLLSDRAKRLITIVGPGGMGKTTLALTAARLALGAEQSEPHFSDGIFFVPLAAIDHVEHALLALADSLRLQLQDRGQLSVEQQFQNFLRDKRILLVLDNFEQLLGSAKRQVSTEPITKMLQAAPGLWILVTSRERLDTRGEVLLPLKGLATTGDTGSGPRGPGLEEAEKGAAELFVEAARRIRPDLEVEGADRDHLTQICRLVEGMPLALELAAAWVDTLTLAEIAGELRADLSLLESSSDAQPERQRSLSAIWDWAWNRLRPQEQKIFAGLCLPPGGFNREAAMAIAGATLPTLASLTGRYFLTLDRGSGRYYVHALLRRYGLDRLEESPAKLEARRDFFDYFQALAESVTSKLRSSEQEISLAELDAERDNLRAVLEWGLAQPTLATATAKLISDLSWYWRMRSRASEGRAWLEEALMLPGLEPSTRAALLFNSGHMAWMQGAFDVAQERQRESRTIWLSLGEPGRLGAAYAQQALGMVKYEQDDKEGARALFEQSLAEFRALGDAWGEAFTLGWMSFVSQALDAWALARQSAELCTSLFRQLGDRWALGLFVGSLAWITRKEGRLAQARVMAEEAYDLRMAFGHAHSAGDALTLLGHIAREEGNLSEAESRYRQALVLYREIGNAPYAAEIETLLYELN